MELDIELLPWQQQVWSDNTRFKIVAAGRRTGKSRLAAWMLIVNALQADRGHGALFYHRGERWHWRSTCQPTA